MSSPISPLLGARFTPDLPTSYTSFPPRPLPLFTTAPPPVSRPPHPPKRDRNSSSPMILTPSSRAFSYLLPGSVPATT